MFKEENKNPQSDMRQQVESVLQMALRDASQTTLDLFGSVRRGSSMYDARETEKYKAALIKCKSVMAFLIRFGGINLGGSLHVGY